jgi:hypothetical protein
VPYLVNNMAQKRMFDKAVIETDNFLNISLSAKALYFLLGMEADDEGFISPTRVLRLYGGEKGDIKNLVDVGLVIPFKSGVVVITNWNQNNYLDKNRIKPTQYQNEKQMLLLTDNNRYELNNRLTSVQPEERSVEENRIEQKSIEESNSTQSISFNDFWILYPKKADKKKAEIIWKKLSYEMQQKILIDVPLRKDGKQWKEGFIPNPTTYLNGERWNDEIIPFTGSKALTNSFNNKDSEKYAKY